MLRIEEAFTPLSKYPKLQQALHEVRPSLHPTPSDRVEDWRDRALAQDTSSVHSQNLRSAATASAPALFSSDQC